MAVQFETPERCLLAQAAIYISDDKLPIPDAIYLSAPDNLLACPKDLIRALRAEKIVASGNLHEAFRTTIILLTSMTSIESGLQWPIIENVGISAELWSEDQIDIAHSRLFGKNDAISKIYRVPPLDPNFIQDHDLAEGQKPDAIETGFTFTNITVSTADLFRISPPPPGVTVKQTPRGGRLPKYRWDEFFAEVIVRADLDGLPETQAELVGKMAEWCLEKWGEQPADSVLKERIAPIYRHSRKAKKKET